MNRIQIASELRSISQLIKANTVTASKGDISILKKISRAILKKNGDSYYHFVEDLKDESLDDKIDQEYGKFDDFVRSEVRKFNKKLDSKSFDRKEEERVFKNNSTSLKNVTNLLTRMNFKKFDKEVKSYYKNPMFKEFVNDLKSLKEDCDKKLKEFADSVSSLKPNS